MNELSLAIRSPKGLAVIVGCSHPGVENILVAATQIDEQLYTADRRIPPRADPRRRDRASR
jgi:hypothetical protein